MSPTPPYSPSEFVPVGRFPSVDAMERHFDSPKPRTSMKSTLLRLLGINTDLEAYATEVLTRPGLAPNDRVQLLRRYLGLSASKQGRPSLGLTSDEKKVRAKSYHRARYFKLKAEGRCVTCAEPNPNAPNHTRCDNCQKKKA